MLEGLWLPCGEQVIGRLREQAPAVPMEMGFPFPVTPRLGEEDRMSWGPGPPTKLGSTEQQSGQCSGRSRVDGLSGGSALFCRAGG